jgi:PQQ-dependent catabolism-associated CXXCW motif protein
VKAAITLLAASCMACAAAAAQTIDANDASRIPFLGQSGRDGYAKYLEAQTQKAFAICVGGAWAYRTGRDVARAAASDAVAAARKNAKGMPCIVYAVNNNVVTGAALRKFTPDEFRQALASARPWKRPFADEDRNEGVPAQGALREQQFHAATPNAIPGARVITTEELRQALSTSSPPALIDVRERPQAAIPGAQLNHALGVDVTRSGTRAATSFLAQAAPDKAAPVVFYCVNWQCWLSYNATLRAVQAGYTSAMWYRGGIAAWFEAELPLEPR